MRIDADREDAHWVRVRQITALGEPLLELQPAGGEIRLAFGGDVANSLVCLARILGAGGPERSLVSALGDSGYSEWLRERLCREGIRLREPTRAASVVTGPSVSSGEAPRGVGWARESAGGTFPPCRCMRSIRPAPVIHISPAIWPRGSEGARAPSPPPTRTRLPHSSSVSAAPRPARG